MWYVWFLPKWRSEHMHVFFGNYFLLQCVVKGSPRRTQLQMLRKERLTNGSRGRRDRFRSHRLGVGGGSDIIGQAVWRTTSFFFRIIRYVNDNDMEWKIPKDTILSYHIVSLWKPVRERKICIAINRFPVEQLTSKGPKISLLILRFLPFPQC